ncbi:BtrH N-terminal domain-containing protein [Chloroflexota bacterium]
MAEKLAIQGYKHCGGKHCWTTALKNALDYHGLHLSEEMLFGLGSGVGFICWNMKHMPAPFIGGRYGKGTEPLIRICQRIGAEAAVIETASAKKGYEDLKRILR